MGLFIRINNKNMNKKYFEVITFNCIYYKVLNKNFQVLFTKKMINDTIP